MPISPGSQIGTAVISGRCPTFLWTAPSGAESVELVVYRVLEHGTEAPEKALAVTLPGSAYGWTPPLDQCLRPGGRYAWSVGIAGDWSEASLFELAPGPSAVEVDEAVAVLRRFLGRESSRQPDQPELAEGRERAVGETLPGAVRPLPGTPFGSRGSESEAEGARDRALAPTPSSSPSLALDGQIHLGYMSDVFLEGEVFLWTDGEPSSFAGSLGLGSKALRSSTGLNNTAVGHTALSLNTSGNRNSAFGEDALYANTTGSYNSAFGEDALYRNSTGQRNSAFGEDALAANTSGAFNSAFGAEALRSNTTGEGNSAFGTDALHSATTGNFNSAFGQHALDENTTGHRNGAFGWQALMTATTGHTNSAFGARALEGLVSGENNVAIGYMAAAYLDDDESGNIMIGNRGVSGDRRTIRIGNSLTQRAFIGGVHGVWTGEPGAISVLVDSEGQLGTTSSSREVKRDIRAIGELSRRLLALEPVAFRYRRHVETHPDASVEFGLIAEEVAEVFPELVVYARDGRPRTVKYHLLSSLLLNELQRQEREMWVHRWALVGLFMTSVGAGLAVRRLG